MNMNPATAVIDPVCKMMIDPDHAAATSRVGDDTFYFCMVACKNAFDADPSKYTAAEKAASCCSPGGSCH